MLQLFTDSDTDIQPQVAAQYGYKMISMPYSVDGTTTFPYEDFEVFDCHAFYEMLRDGVLPTTSALSEEKYIEYFEPDFAAGNDILYVHFSAAMTVTFDVMHKAVDRLLEKYPDRRFYEVDTKGITTISYLIVREIGELYKQGKSAEEILAWAKDEVDHFAMYFFADDLKFFKRSGRVSGLAAMMGTLVGVRPIIFMSAEGKMESIGTERGRFKAMNRLLDEVDKLKLDLSSHRLAVGHTDAPELAEEMADLLRERFGEDLVIDIVPTNPTAGSHCGPNGVGVTFHAIHR